MTEERGKLKFKNDEELINYYCSMEHPKTFSPAIMIVIFLTSIVGAIIGMELIVRFGLSTNSSIIGALIAVIIGMIPLKFTRQFKNIHTQILLRPGFPVLLLGLEMY